MTPQGNHRRRARRIRSLAILIAGVLITPLLASAAAALEIAGCTTAGNYTVCRATGEDSRPADGTVNRIMADKIASKIRAAIDVAGPGDYIRVAMFQWYITLDGPDYSAEDNIQDGTGLAVLYALRDAAEAGMSVRVVLGERAEEAKIWLDAANRNGAARDGYNSIDIALCSGSCMTGSGSMHNKFVLIRSGAKRTVLQASNNLNDYQELKSGNLLIVRGDSELFGHYLDYWRRLYVGSWTWNGVTWANSDRARTGDNDLSKAYFFPQSSGDPLATALGNVTDCRTNDRRIYVSASHVPLVGATSFERQAVIDQLEALSDEGCDVKMVVARTAARLALEKKLGDAAVRCNDWNHSKLVLVDARYAGEWRKVSFIGSYNLSNNSLRGATDVMLRIINTTVTDLHFQHFSEIWNNSGDDGDNCKA